MKGMVEVKLMLNKQKRKQKPRWWEKLVKDCKEITVEERINLILLRHKLGIARVTAPNFKEDQDEKL